MDPVSMIVGAVLAGTGWLTGRYVRRKRRADDEPVCQCEHGYNTHDAKTGICRAVWDEKRWTNQQGNHYVQMRCVCLRYTGPQPPPGHQWLPPVDDLFTKPGA